MICYHDKIGKKDLKNGIIIQVLGTGERMNVLHWDMEDGSVVATHQHAEEQFGYVIKGGFNIIIGNETATIREGDAYFVPPNAPHKFIAIGETEAIDVFNPIRKDYPKGE
jgi:quercetin dioxygenase-like cupin family protein